MSRRLLAVACVLTALVAVGWFTIPGLRGGNTTPTNTLPDRVGRVEVAARAAVQAGTDLRSLTFQGAVRSAIDTQLTVIATERSALQRRAAGAPSTRQQIAADAAGAAVSLERAVTSYRDALGALRLAAVATAETSVDAALAQLDAAVKAWDEQAH